MNRFSQYKPFFDEIWQEYRQHRTIGKSRCEAISAIRESYAMEIDDDDDCVMVIIGLVLALRRKRELTTDVIEEAMRILCQFQLSANLNSKEQQYLRKIEDILKDESMCGDEAVYRQRTAYVPDWVEGDTFSHTLSNPQADALGIQGWLILFYKVGAYINNSVCHQLMCVSLCPPDKLPTSCSELQSLGFLPMMSHGEKFDYLAQLAIKSKVAERSFELTRIGNFPGVKLPNNRTDEKPEVTMPLFSYLKRSDPWPCYEEQVCHFYKKFRKFLQMN